MHSALSLTGRRWIIKREKPLAIEEDVVALLAAERGLHDIVHGKMPLLSDPMLFPEMGRAVERIRRAIQDEETVGIFGDYDADGITGVAQLVRYFRRRGGEPVVLLPHRVHDGYGMKRRSVDVLHSKGVKLIITVDTGIVGHQSIEHARSLGIDVIITDHHRPLGGRPPAFAVIHPRVPADFPNQHLSGSGVAFNLVRALETQPTWDGIEEDFVLATIGTIGDVSPLTGENRTLVIHGLKFLQMLPEGPLKEFASFVQAKENVPLTAEDIAFRIVPRINASGRIDYPDVALDALLNGGESLKKLHEFNTRRQALTLEFVTLAEEFVDTQDLFLVVVHERFTHGTVGLVAGKLAQKYGRPALAACCLGGMATASIRSIPQCDVTAILGCDLLRPLLHSFGGHMQAAGCSFAVENLDELRRRLNQAMTERGFSLAELQPTVAIDTEISTQHLSLTFAKSLQRLEPFGQSNDHPLFLLKDVELTAVRCVGSDGKHLQARILGTKVIGFGLGGLAEELETSEKVDVVFSLSCNQWNGREDCQVVLEDARKSS